MGRLAMTWAKVDLCTNLVSLMKLPGLMSKTWRLLVWLMLPVWRLGQSRMFANGFWKICPSLKRRRGGLSKGLKVAVQSGGVSRMLREPGLGENSAFFPHGSLGQDTFSFAWFASKKWAWVRFWAKLASFRLLFWLVFQPWFRWRTCCGGNFRPYLSCVFCCCDLGRQITPQTH